MNRFLIIALAVLTVLFTFLGFRVTGIGYYSWVIAGIMIGLLTLYPLIWFDQLPPWANKILRNIVHFDMGLSSMFVFFIMMRDVASLPLALINRDFFAFIFLRPATLTLFGVAVILLCWGYVHAANGPVIKRVQIPISGLPSGLEGFTMVQVSDLHAGAGITRKYVEKVVKMVAALQADLVVMTGYIADGNFEKYHDRSEPLKLLCNHSRVLYITGNHEYLKDSDWWLDHFQRMGMQLLLNGHTVVSKNDCTILFAGVIDPEVKDVDPNLNSDLEKALLGSPDADVRVLLSHRPDLAKKASGMFNLQLSGHTHGGQFFPWTFLLNLLVPFAKGLNKCGKMWIYTSPGAGFWAPPHTFRDDC